MKNTSIKHMFNVTCVLTGVSVKVRRPVYMARVDKVQKLTRRITGTTIGRSDAMDLLNTSYVSLAARKEHNVDMLGNKLDGTELYVPIKQTRKPAEKPARAVRVKSEAPVVTEEVIAA